MWEIINKTPYAVERTWIRDINGAEVWVVAVKATYTLHPDGNVTLSETQIPVYEGPSYDKNGILLHETDLGAPKKATDILINGHVQMQKESGSQIIGIKIGHWHKLAIIRADKGKEAAQLQKIPLDFSVMPAGSKNKLKEHVNPLSCELYDNSKSPNIIFINKKDEGIGLSAIPAFWLTRRQFTGTYDENWMKTRAPLYPSDFKDEFWQIAPKDQQVKNLNGGEIVVLANLLPIHDTVLPLPLYHFRLPKSVIRFNTDFYDGTQMLSLPKLHTIYLDIDKLCVSLVWHMSLSCHNKVNLLKSTHVWEKEIYPTPQLEDKPVFTEWEQLCH